MPAATLKTGEFQEAAQNCTEVFAKYFVLRISKNKIDANFTYGIVISRKIAPSCKRNKIKRRLRAIISEYVRSNSIPHTVIIYARKSILAVDYNKLEESLLKNINKFKLL